LLQFWHFPIYGENACVLEGRHGGLVGTKALEEENGPCLLYGYDYGFVFGLILLYIYLSVFLQNAQQQINIMQEADYLGLRRG
jgi:hypothetical protein